MRIPLALIFVGFVLVFAGAILTATSTANSSVGGVVLIGPIPIIFGSGKLGEPLAFLATLLTILAILVFAFSIFSAKRANTPP